MKTIYEETAIILCVDKNTEMQVDTLNFIPEQKLSVSVNKSVKLELWYNNKTKVYEGKMAGLTFVSNGPNSRTFKEGRTR